MSRWKGHADARLFWGGRLQWNVAVSTQTLGWSHCMYSSMANRRRTGKEWCGNLQGFFPNTLSCSRLFFADSLQMWWMFLVSCILKAWRCLLKRPRRFLQIRANCMVEIFWNVGHLVFLPRCFYEWVDFPSISGFRMWIPFFCFCCVADMDAWCLPISTITNATELMELLIKGYLYEGRFGYVFQLSND